jgi:hypothetical protein
MKTITLICAMVLITTGAFAGNNIANNSNQSSLVKSDLSSYVHVSHLSSNTISRRNKRHKLKQMFKNPFRIISLSRNNRY